jgi:hypothetical protein
MENNIKINKEKIQAYINFASGEEIDLMQFSQWIQAQSGNAIKFTRPSKKLIGIAADLRRGANNGF